MEQDLPQLLRVLAALVFVLALMGGLVVLLRRLGYITGGTPGGKKRLKIVETMYIDSRRRLAIIQRDEKEHLIILGPTTETVVESGFESDHDGGIK
jgi:flagellar protein FliO/FliZ